MIQAIVAGKALKAVGGFFATYWKHLIVLGLAAFIWWKWHSLNKTVDDLRTANVALVRDNTNLKLMNNQLGKLAQENQAAVSDIKKLNKDIADDFADLQKQSDRRAERDARTIADLRKKAAPKTNAESVDYIIDALARRFTRRDAKRSVEPRQAGCWVPRFAGFAIDSARGLD